jgi:gliding motility-associated protein GldC
MKKEKIEIQVELDDANVPSKIEWISTDGPSQQKHEVKAFLLSLFDKKSMETMKIDLWTKEMQVGEMDRLVYYTLRSLADSYKRSTNNHKLAGEMNHFAHYFGEKTEILPPSEE